MTNLILIQGKAGSGKTTLSRYAENELGFSRYAQDNYISRMEGSFGVKFRGFGRHVYRDHTFWQKFEDRRGKVPYNWETAAEVMQRNAGTMENRNGYCMTEEDAFHLVYVIIDNLFADRDISLGAGRDVIIEACISPEGRKHAFTTSIDDEIQRYLINLRVSGEELIRRLVEAKGMDLETSQRSTARPFDFTFTPSFGNLAVLDYQNETTDDYERIKDDLKRCFTRF